MDSENIIGITVVIAIGFVVYVYYEKQQAVAAQQLSAKANQSTCQGVLAVAGAGAAVAGGTPQAAGAGAQVGAALCANSTINKAVKYGSDIIGTAPNPFSTSTWSGFGSGVKSFGEDIGSGAKSVGHYLNPANW